MDRPKHVFIIGGGAAGLVAAISARRLGAKVTIFERNPRIGKKILATGNGRCNFTNVNVGKGCYSGNNPEFVHDALETFPAKNTIKFFEKLGIQHKVEASGKVFPMSDQASSFLDVFLYELDTLGINVLCDSYVKDINKEQGGFVVKLENDKTFKGDRVIMTTGGKAMPSSGSDGNGYDIVKRLGHTITPTFPALVQIMLEGPFFKRIAGVKILGTVKAIHNGRTIIEDSGDILFANYGISGPPVLQISRKIGKLLKEGEETYIKVSIIDNIPRNELKTIIKRRCAIGPDKPVDFSFVGLINKRLIPVVLKEAGISDMDCAASSLTDKEIEGIVDTLIGWELKVRGTKGWQSAQVTAGGINTDEIRQETMESKLVKGLYFAGEIVDIDGQCGGFNLQWAWASGFMAGQNAAVN